MSTIPPTSPSDPSHPIHVSNLSMQFADDIDYLVKELKELDYRNVNDPDKLQRIADAITKTNLDAEKAVKFKSNL